MAIVYGTLYETWMIRTSPTATVARMVRTVLGYLAGAVGADNWSIMVVLPEQHAMVLLNGAFAKTTLQSQTKANYRNYLRRLYRFATKEGIDTNAAKSSKLWAPAPNHGAIPRRVQVAYDRFVIWAIGRSVWSDTVRAQDLCEWALAEKGRSNQHWRQDYQRLQSVWEMLVKTNSVPRIQFLPLPAKLTARYALPIERWSPHLREEWEQVCQAASAPLRNGGMRPWRPITREGYQRRLCLFLGWFVQKYPKVVLAQETWASLLVADRCQQYLNWLVQRSGKRYINPSHTSFLRFVRGLHRFELGSPANVVQSFTDLCRRCDVEERDKASRMAPYPILDKGYRQLLDRVLTAMRTHNGKQSSDPSLARSQVNAIILGLLTTRALRRVNIVNIRIGINLIKINDGYELRYAAEEMKGHRRFDVVVPSELAPIITDYLRRGYFALAGRVPAEGDALLLTSEGAPLPLESFTSRVRQLTRRYVGRSLNPHLFRHIVATHAAQVWRMTPTELAAFLAHRNVLTIMRYYEVTSPTRAAERFDSFRNGAA